MSRWSYAVIAAAGIAGALGVMEAAVAAHKISDTRLATSSNFLLLNAAACIALAAVARGATRGRAWFLIAASVLLAGTLLFCGDLSMLALNGRRPFPFAAPIGGSLMILSWLIAAGTGIVCCFSTEN